MADLTLHATLAYMGAMAKSNTERGRALRDRMRKAGYVLKHLWVHPKDWPRVKALLAKRKRPG